jgi:hypothetical protein
LILTRRVQWGQRAAVQQPVQRPLSRSPQAAQSNGREFDASLAQVPAANSGSIDDKLSQRFQQALKIQL